MVRVKSKREYSIVLRNKTLGDFYFKYFNYTLKCYVFCKPTKRISKWKTTKIPLEECRYIYSELNKDNRRIFLECTDLVNNGSADKDHPNIIKNRNKYYFVISKVSLPETNLSKINFDIEQYTTMVKDSCNSIISSLDTDNIDVAKINRNIKDIEKHTGKIVTYKNLLESQLDVIDVSYNFRFIKMKIINGLANEASEE